MKREGAILYRRRQIDWAERDVFRRNGVHGPNPFLERQTRAYFYHARCAAMLIWLKPVMRTRPSGPRSWCFGSIKAAWPMPGEALRIEWTTGLSCGCELNPEQSFGIAMR